MAFNKDDSQNLEQLAQNIAKNQPTIKLPGGDNSEKEVTYSEMDLFSGLCSAALFGITNRNRQNIDSLISGGQKPLLGQILDILKDVTNYVQANDKDNKQDNTLLNTINNGWINVRLMSIDKNAFNELDDKNLFQLLSGLNVQQSNNQGNQSANIVIDINGITNIDELNKALLNMTDLTNDKGLLDGIQGLIKSIQEINTLTSINTSDIVTSFENISQAMIELNQLKLNIPELNGENFKTQIQEIINSLDVYNVSLQQFDQIVDKLNVSKNKIDELGIAIEGLPLEQLNDKLFNNKEFQNLLQSLSKLSHGFDDIKGLGELINGIINLSNVKSDNIDIEGIRFLENLTSKNGYISSIIKNINQLGLQSVDPKTIQAIKFVQEYFYTIKSLTDIGILEKIRIISNVLFFKLFVNKTLPGLIKEIDNNFKDLTLEDNVAINNLRDYFSALKSISSLSIKDQINIWTSIQTLRTLIIDKLANLVKDISTKFGNINLDDNIKDIFNIFDKIQHLTINTSLKEQRKNLYELNKFLFGSSLAGTGVGGKVGRFIDNLNEESSILSIINRLKLEQKSFNNAKALLNKLEIVLDQLSKIISNNNINPKLVKELAKSINILYDDIINEIINIGQDESIITDLKAGFQVINEFNKQINKTFKDISLNDMVQKIVIGQNIYKQFKDTIKLFKELEKLTKILETISKIKLSNKVFKLINNLADKLAIIIKKFTDIDPSKINAAIKLMNQITKFMLIGSAILIVGTLLMSQFSLEDVFKFVGGLTVMMYLFKSVFKLMSSKEFDENNLNDKIKLMNQINLLMMSCGLTLALCTSLMKNVELETLGIFLAGVAVLLFVSGVLIWGLNKFAKDIKVTFNIAKDLSLLIFVCGITLALSSYIGQNVSIPSVKAFGLLLMGLILSVMVPLKFFKGISTIMFKGVDELSKLVLYCGLTLMLAGLVTEYLDMKSLITFTVMLTFMVSGIVFALGLFEGGEIKGAKDLGTLVMYCAGAMLIGGLLFMLLGEPFKNAISNFAWELFKFTAGILLVVGLASLMGKEAIQHMKNLTSIIQWSATVLLIGGLIMMLGGLPLKKAIKDFAEILFWFVAGIGLIVTLVGLFVKEDKLKQMWMLALIVGVSAFAIALGPILLKEYRISKDDVWSFVLQALVLTGGMALIVFFLGRFLSTDMLIKGLLAMVGIEILIYGLGICIGKLSETVKLLNRLGYDVLWEGIGHIGLILLAVVGVIAALGGAMYTGVGAIVFAAGAAAFATLEGLIYGLAACIEKIAKAIKLADEIKGVDMEDVMKPIFGFIESSKGVLTSFSGKEILKIKLVTNSLSGLGNMIANIADSIQHYAELKVPTDWDPNTGKPTGYKQLNTQDFANAAYNIGLIISILGRSILAIYQGQIFDPIANKTYKIMEPADAKQMFSGGGLLSGGTKFAKVVKSVTKLGSMISGIAQGIQTYANLKMPIKWNENGSPVAFSSLTTEDFTKAAQNIGKVISTLGMSIIAIYHGKIYDPENNVMKSFGTLKEDDIKQMFESGWLSDSPFNKVVKSTSRLGSLISSLAFGIQNYANLRIPTDWDPKTGKPIKYEKMTDQKFTNAGEVIGKVIYSLGRAIIDVANSSEFKSIYDSQKIKTIVDSIGKVSNFIGPLGNVISKYASGKFPILEYKDGKLFTNGYYEVDEKNNGWETLKEKLKTNISNVLLGLGTALNDIMSSDDIKNLTKSNDKVTNFLNNVKLLSESLKTIYDNISIILQKKIWSSQIIKHIKNPFNQFCNILAFEEGGVKEWMINNNDDASDFIELCNSFGKVLLDIFTNINKIIEFNIENENITKFISDPFDTYIGIATKEFTFNSTKQEELMNFNGYIEDWINILNKVNENLPNKTNVLSNSIVEIFDKINQIQQNSAFADHVETLERYVKAIDEVDITKVESLTTLAYAVTNLGDKIGNIDKFTNTLAGTVSNTLTKLSTEINNASTIIKDADKLHAKRQSHIKASIKDITDLMNKAMVVEIKNDQPTEAAAGGGLTGGSLGSEDNSNQTSSFSTSDNGNEMTNISATPETSSGNSKNITIDIDYNKLAEAIARAFKKING